MKIAIIAIVVVAVLLVSAGGAAAFYLAGQAQANSAIRATNKDIDRMNASLTVVDRIEKSKPAYPDFSQASTPAEFITEAKQFDNAADQDIAQIAQIGSVAQGDRATLADAQRQLNAAYGSPFTVFQRSRLEQGRRRAGYEQQALDLALQMVAVAETQVRSARSAIDALSAYATMIQKLQAGDYAGSLAEYATVHSLLAQAGTQGQAGHLTGVWDTLLTDLNKLADDTRDGVQDIQKGDYSAAQTAASTLDADGKALDGLDTSSLDQNAYLDGLLQQIKALEAKPG